MKQPAGIVIQIDVLEVEGLSQADAPSFQRAVEQELARLVTDHALPSGTLQSRSLVSITTGDDVTLDRQANAVASAIYRALVQ